MPVSIGSAMQGKKADKKNPFGRRVSKKNKKRKGKSLK